LKYSFVAINQLLKSSKLATVRAVVECGKTNLYKQQLVRLTDASPSDLRVINKFLFTKIMYCYAQQHTLQCATKKKKRPSKNYLHIQYRNTLLASRYSRVGSRVWQQH